MIEGSCVCLNHLFQCAIVYAEDCVGCMLASDGAGADCVSAGGRGGSAAVCLCRLPCVLAFSLCGLACFSLAGGMAEKTEKCVRGLQGLT